MSACEIHRIVCGILEVTESDPPRVSLVAIELAKSEFRASDVLAGVVRFTTSICTVRTEEERSVVAML